MFSNATVLVRGRKLGTFIATLLDIKNTGDGVFDIRVRYENTTTSQMLERVYTATSSTYSATSEFIAFIKKEVDELNAANVVLSEVSAMVGQQIQF